MLKYFKSYSSSLIVVIPIIGIILWGSTYNYQPSSLFVFDGYRMPLFALLMGFIEDAPFWGMAISLLVILLMALFLVRLNTKFIIIPERTYLPAVLFVVVSGCLAALHGPHPVIFGSLFLLFALFKVFGSYKVPRLSYNFFEAGFLLGVGSLFYFPLTAYLILIWISLAILNRGYWREWIFPLAGFVAPYILVFGYYYLYTDDINALITGIQNSVTQNNILAHPEKYYYIFFGILLFCIIVSSYFMLGVFQTLKIHARKYYMIFFWLFIITIGMYFLIPSAGFELIVFAAIPISYLFTKHYISSRVNWWCNLTFFMILIALIFVQLRHLGFFEGIL